MAAYFAMIAAGFVIARILPHRFSISRIGITAMLFFVANWTNVSAQLGQLLAPLWSISVEEQFYIIWPPIIRAGGSILALAAAIFFTVSAGVWVWLFPGRGWQLWYDTPVEFLFFAAGVMIACATHSKRTERINGAIRSGLLIAGLFSLGIAARVGCIGTDNVQGLSSTRIYIGYSGAVTGCALIFVAILGMSNIPRSLIYLGKISYGLYVFHAGSLVFSNWLTIRFKLTPSSALYMLVVDSIALLLCILVAHLSYKYSSGHSFD